MESCTEPSPNVQLLSQISQGSHEAFAAIHRRYAPMIEKYLNQLGYKNKYLQDDIIQDIFLILWSKREKWEEVKNFEGYLFTMTRNILITELRKTKRHPASLVEVEFQHYISDYNPQENIERRELNKIYYKGIQLLPRQTKKVCLLNEGGMKTQEIARTLRISPNTVKNLRQALPGN